MNARLFVSFFCVISFGCRSADSEDHDSRRYQLKQSVAAVTTVQRELLDSITGALSKTSDDDASTKTPIALSYERVKLFHIKALESRQRLALDLSRMDESANRLFLEWKTEYGSFHNERFRKLSSLKLQEKEKAYGELSQGMKVFSKELDLKLAELGDRVLFLKHLLNAEEIENLRNELTELQNTLQNLKSDVELEMNEADRFLSSFH